MNQPIKRFTGKRFSGYIPEGHKYCSQCKQVLLKTEFYKNKSQKDGLGISCINCGKLWQKNNPEKVKECDKRKYEKYKEKIIKRVYKRYIDKKPEILKKQHQYYQNHKEHYKKIFKLYAKNHREIFNKSSKKWDKNHPEQRREINKKWRHKNPEKVKEKNSKHRSLGFNILWKPEIIIEPIAYHHIDKQFVIAIPKILHKSVSHNVWTGRGMNKINKLVFKYVIKQTKIDNFISDGDIS